MRSLRAWMTRIAGMMIGRRRDREFDQELQANIQLHVDDNLLNGLPLSEAKRRAFIDLGGVAPTREQYRERRSVRWLDALGRDVRFGIRLLARSPGFACLAIGILAIVIGANTVVYTLVDHLFVRPLPYPDAGRLVAVSRHYEQGNVSADNISQNGITALTLREKVPSLDLAVGGGSGGVNLVADGRAEYVQQQRVSAGYFRVLGVPPALGREFTAEEDRQGGPMAVVLSHRTWTRLFDADPAILGKTISLRGEPFTVVGVMPAAFRPYVIADLWTPIRPSTEGEGSGQNYLLVARLRDGTTFGEANGQVQSVGNALLNKLYRPGPDLRLSMRLVSLREGLYGETGKPVLLIWAAVGLVLLLGCVNIAGLLLVRGAARVTEVSTRMALGGSRAAIVRQLLVESVILAVCGGAVGAGLGVAVGRLATPQLFEVFGFSAVPDLRVLIIVGGATLLTSVVFGLFPAVQTARLNLRETLVENGSLSIAGHARQWPARAMVVTEIVLCIVLLVGSGLLIRTFRHLSTLQPGFDDTNVIAGTVSLQDARYRSDAEVNQLFARTLESIRRAPGVEAAAVALSLPYERPMNSGWRFHTDAEQRREAINVTYVTPDYFKTLRIPLREGRAFTDGDTRTSAPVVIVNEAFVQRYARDESPIGRFLAFGRDNTGTPLQIVGVVAAVQQQNSGLGSYGPVNTIPGAFVPAAQYGDGFSLAHTWFQPSWIVRTTSESPATIIPAMRSALSAVDPQLPFIRFRTFDDLRGEALVMQRIETIVLGALAGVALVLATLGVYGLVSHSVARRRREFGVRLALGATPLQIIKLATGAAVVLGLVGVSVGLVLARTAAQLIRGLLFGVQVHDLPTFAAAGILMFVTAIVAGLIPALRTLRLSQATILRGL
jgi:predicted permease